MSLWAELIFFFGAAASNSPTVTRRRVAATMILRLLPAACAWLSVRLCVCRRECVWSERERAGEIERVRVQEIVRVSE